MLSNSFGLIFGNAFNANAVSGGLVGTVIRMGVARGVFSNEAGLGTAPIAQAAAKPGDPVLQARLDAIRRRGGNPFMEHQVPQAAIALKQGAGRLIRDVSDYGVLMLGDPRLLNKRYGRLFINSMPNILLSDLVSPAAFGRVIGVNRMFADTGYFAAPHIVGILLHHFGFDIPLYAIAGYAFVMMILASVFIPGKVRQ